MLMVVYNYNYKHYTIKPSLRRYIWQEKKKRARNLKSSYIHFAIRYGGISIALYDVRFTLAALPLAKKQAKIRWKCNFWNLHYLPQGLLLYYFYQIFLELYSQNENKQLILKKKPFPLFCPFIVHCDLGTTTRSLWIFYKNLSWIVLWSCPFQPILPFF